MNKTILREVITDQHTKKLVKKLILRHAYMQLETYQQSSQIVILSGIRRCGKSTLLEQIRQGNPEQDFYINFDDDRLVQFELSDFQALYELFIEMYGPQKTFYFDEIQNIVGWERFVRRLHDEGNKIYITGSNAAMLSAELGTRLTGRYLQFNLYPFSFYEFLDFQDQKKLISQALTTETKGVLKSAWNEYLVKGGLPGYLALPEPEYLHSIYQSILYRDIIVRHKINSDKAIKELSYYLASNVSKLCTYNSLKKTIGVSSASTVSDYCSYLQDSYLCFFVTRFDYAVSKQIASPKKVYFIDTALAVNTGFRFSQDQGRLLENMVFLELKRRGYDIFYHQDRRECDFIIRKGRDVVAAIQVCMDLEDPQTREREFLGLREAMASYHLDKGLIITLDTVEEQDGVTVMPIWKWLLKDA